MFSSTSRLSLIRVSLAARALSGKAGLKKPNVAIVGATGAVGAEFLDCIARRNFPYSNLKLLASARSKGQKMTFQGKEYVVEELTDESFHDVDIALFSAGGAQSRRYAPAAVKQGAIVVDNSSAYRMDPSVPLVIPEINPEAIKEHKGIIANPNCSTIIMAVAVYPIHKVAGVSRVVASTYQAASGAGAAAMRELEGQAKDWVAGNPLRMDIFKRQYLWNLFSHNSAVTSNGYNEEEIKMVKETTKIFNDNDIKVTATCVRVPVLRAHCESLNLTLKKPLSESEVRAILEKAPGVEVVDNREKNKFPEPIDASGKFDVLVGRIRPDFSQPEGYGVSLFVAGDQLLKGAALNAVQIAEHLLKK